MTLGEMCNLFSIYLRLWIFSLSFLVFQLFCLQIIKPATKMTFRSIEPCCKSDHVAKWRTNISGGEKTQSCGLPGCAVNLCFVLFFCCFFFLFSFKKFTLVSVDVGLFQKPRKKIISIDTYSHAMWCGFDFKQWTDNVEVTKKG